MQLCSSLNILWLCVSLGLEWKLTFSSPVTTAEFSKFAGILCSTVAASSFRIWNSSIGIPSPPLVLFVVILPKVHLTSHSRMSGSRLGHNDILIFALMSWIICSERIWPSRLSCQDIQELLKNFGISTNFKSFQVVLEVKNLPANAGNTSNSSSIPRSGRYPGTGNGIPLK